MSEWKEKARAGDVEAMHQLGWSCYHGRDGVKKDYGEALVWYGKAAAKGHGGALGMVGYMHEKGEGTPVSLLNALNYYKQAKEKGFNSTYSTDAIPRLEAAVAADPALRAAAAAAARLEQEKAHMLQQDAANKQKEAELKQQQQKLDAERVRHQQKDAELKQQQQALEAERVRLQQLDETLKRERAAIDAIKSEQEEQQNAKEAAAAAFTKAKKDAAAAKQAEILEERHAEGSAYVRTRDAVAAAWEPTKVELADCPVHAGPLAPGQSVLLEKCLHTICRDCTPHMIQPDNSVRCPVCQANSPLKRDALPPHPFIEAELAAGEAHDCAMCQTVPEDERISATVKCTSCAPEKLLCEGHAVVHRMNPKTAAHTVTSLPHGGAALRCPTHDQPIAAYCTGCHQLICFACFASTHPATTHPARLLTDTKFVEGLQRRLVEGVAVARTVAEALIDHAADATVAATELDVRDAAIASEIDRTVNVLNGILERRREAAHDERLARTRDERAALQKTREESEYHWRIVMSAADLAEQLATGTLLGVNATAVMVQLEAAATERLHAVLQFKPERSVPAPAILRFHLDESLAEQLAHLGEVVQDAPSS